jgi:hypothetical protein
METIKRPFSSMKKNCSCLICAFCAVVVAMILNATFFAPTAAGDNVKSPEKPPEKIVICHNGNTLELPKPAVDAHLREHPNDTLGPCPSPAPKPKPGPK